MQNSPSYEVAWSLAMNIFFLVCVSSQRAEGLLSRSRLQLFVNFRGQAVAICYFVSVHLDLMGRHVGGTSCECASCVLHPLVQLKHAQRSMYSISVTECWHAANAAS